MCRVNMLIWDVVGGQKSTSLKKHPACQVSLEKFHLR